MKKQDTVISLPYKYTPRDYQLPFWSAFDSGKFKRFLLVWPRRAGKDRTCINLVAREMAQRVGTYYYLFPEYAQGKKAIWEGMDSLTGFRYIKHFPEPYLDGKPNDTEMKIRYKNGSVFQIIGAATFDKNVIGTNPLGVVFSEFSVQDPKAWDFIRPILRENKGWAIFNGTPRGKNHLWKMLQMALHNKNWWVSWLDNHMTKTVTPEEIEMDREEGMTEEMIQQEYFTDFTAAVSGAYYSKEIDNATKEGRFCHVPYNPAFPVHTVWDLGVGDNMAIGFYQVIGEFVHMIDFEQGGGIGIPDYIKIIQNKGYVYGKHFAPHDSKHIEIGSQKTRVEIAAELGIHFEDIPNVGVQNGIDAARMFFRILKVDMTRCAKWIEYIPQYTKEYDSENKVFKNFPLHNFSSHAADQFRYAAVIVDKMRNWAQKRTSIFLPNWRGYNRR